jgi:hypothetical protein
MNELISLSQVGRGEQERLSMSSLFESTFAKPGKEGKGEEK